MVAGCGRDRWYCWVCERGAVRERIIKNCKKMNILLNKCVEQIN